MNNISFQPSLQNHNGHKSIGAGGSFWLPPKMKAQTFENSFKNYSTANDVTKHGQSTLDKKVTTRVNSSTTNLADSKSTQDTRAVQSRHLGSNGLISKQVPAEIRQNLSPNGNQQNSKVITHRGELTRVNTLSHPPPVLPIKIPQVSRVIVPSPRGSLILAKNNQELKRRDKFSSSGTRNAHLDFQKNESYIKNTEDNPEKDLSSYNKTLTASEVVDEIKGSLSDISLLSSHRNGVVRFAFSLEDGSSVSVRIQQMKDHFQICFICDNNPSLVSLSRKFNSPDNEINTTDLPLNIHFFNSYKQMDNVLSSKPSLT